MWRVGIILGYRQSQIDNAGQCEYLFVDVKSCIKYAASMQDKIKTLTPTVLNIVQAKGTEAPGSGAYCMVKQPGTYLCRRCGLGLFDSNTKFDSGTGWPSFDAALSQNVKTVLDADGRRTEILCNRCDAHLGHVFAGEGFTKNNTRHCVNSLSIDLVSKQSVEDSEEAIFAGGCFWGLEHFLGKVAGVLKVESGYIGGARSDPTYEQVCSEATGHYEAVRVLFDPAATDFETVCKVFFETHDPTQLDGQGPDIGPQYRSAIFVLDDKQNATAHQLVSLLEQKNLKVVTQIIDASIFWPAEDYHQSYYAKNGKTPYCHAYVKRF